MSPSPRILLALPLLLMAGCGSPPDEGSSGESGRAGSPGKYYCVSLGGRKLCFERDDIYWPVEDSDDPRGVAALMPAFAFEDPECSQPASTVEQVRQFLIAEASKGESLQRWSKADFEHYAPYLTTKLSGNAPELQCWKIREKSPVPDRGFLCRRQSGSSASTLITCNGDDVPVPHCNHRIYVEGLRMAMHYPRQCLPHWKKLESIPLGVIRDAEAIASKPGK